MPRLASQCADPKRFDSDTNFHFDLFFNANVRFDLDSDTTFVLIQIPLLVLIWIRISLRFDLDSDTTFRFDLIPERHPDKYFNKFK